MKTVLELITQPMPVLRRPVAEDGADIWALVRNSKPLDENSMYCNLIQCDHFRETCVVAELDGDIVGWVSGHVLPYDAATLFIWQVAVAEAVRGCGLASIMLGELVRRDACKSVTRVQTTITADNAASWALFRRFARFQRSKLDIQPYFTQSAHLRDRHKSENMVTIRLCQKARRAA